MSSVVLNALKTVKERIPDNYTTGQLYSVFDTLLYRSIYPIIDNTNYVDRILVIILGWNTNIQRRKISSLPKERFGTYVLSFLCSKDKALRRRIYRHLRLERNITLYIIQRWLTLMKPWPSLHILYSKGDTSVLQKIASIERIGMVVNNSDLFCVLREVEVWSNQTLQFKQMILEKYMRMIMLESQSYYKMQQTNNPHLKQDLDDIAQNFILAAYKAIDKCDERKGTLTSYIQDWLKSAKVSNHFRHEYGTAFNVPNSLRKKMAMKETSANNITVTIDSEEAQSLLSGQDIEKEAERSNEINFVRALAKVADPVGIARIFLGIGEILNEEELKQLRSASIQIL